MTDIDQLRKALPGDGWTYTSPRGRHTYSGVIGGRNVIVKEDWLEVPARGCAVQVWTAEVRFGPTVGVGDTPLQAAQCAHHVIEHWHGWPMPEAAP